jgi:hypothetical protein
VHSLSLPARAGTTRQPCCGAEHPP